MKSITIYTLSVIICLLTTVSICNAQNLTTPTVNFSWEKRNSDPYKIEFVSGTFSIGINTSLENVSSVSYPQKPIAFYGGSTRGTTACGRPFMLLTLRRTSSNLNRFAVPENATYELGTFSDTWAIKAPLNKDTSAVNGNREFADLWMNSSGDLFIFGGQNYDSQIQQTLGCGLSCVSCSVLLRPTNTNSLIKYSKEGNSWETLSSVSNTEVSEPFSFTSKYLKTENGPLVIPYNSDRKRRTWTGQNDELWLFAKSPELDSNENLGLLKYNDASGFWTPMLKDDTTSTSANSSVPDDFSWGATWTGDDDNLWLFGDGTNTMWKYDIPENAWFEMNKSVSTETNFNYGVRGIFSEENRPGVRDDHSFWKDNDGNFWVFGGNGEAEDGVGQLNDLWKYDVLLNQWAWVSGSPGINDPGMPFMEGSDSEAYPAGAFYPHFWIDGNGSLNMLGGRSETIGNDTSSTTYYFTEYWVGAEIK